MRWVSLGQWTDGDAKRWAVTVGVLLAVLAVLLYGLFSHPRQFPAGEIVRIERGATLDAVARRFSDEHIIRFPAVFKLTAWLTTGDGSMKAGDYYFCRPVGLAILWYRVSRGIYGTDGLKIVIPEGWTVEQMGVEFEKRSFFSRAEWKAAAGSFEGYLFPDTYYFPLDATPADIMTIMRDNFESKLDIAVRSEIASQRKTLEDIVTMASLIEKEANGGSEDAPTIAGILWKRISEGIGLQVDAALTYVTGRPSLELRQSDLALDSPYNTYKYRGLPPTPIASPGLDAILAAVYPQKTPYLFYLHGSDGRAHYAITFEEHIANKEKYLR